VPDCYVCHNDSFFYVNLERNKAPLHTIVLSGRLKALTPFYVNLERSKAPPHTIVLSGRLKALRPFYVNLGRSKAPFLIYALQLKVHIVFLGVQRQYLLVYPLDHIHVSLLVGDV